MLKNKRNKKKSCGGCTACCTAIGVESIGKPYGSNCEHQTCTGCAIYQNRPPECRAYECWWKLNPKVPMELRPDLTGVVLHMEHAEEKWWMYFCEVRPNAFIEAMKNPFFRNELGFGLMFCTVVLVLYGADFKTDYHTDARYGADTFSSEKMKASGFGNLYVLPESAAESVMESMAELMAK